MTEVLLGTVMKLWVLKWIYYSVRPLPRKKRIRSELSCINYVMGSAFLGHTVQVVCNHFRGIQKTENFTTMDKIRIVNKENRLSTSSNMAVMT